LRGGEVCRLGRAARGAKPWLNRLFFRAGGKHKSGFGPDCFAASPIAGGCRKPGMFFYGLWAPVGQGGQGVARPLNFVYVAPTDELSVGHQREKTHRGEGRQNAKKKKKKKTKDIFSGGFAPSAPAAVSPAASAAAAGRGRPPTPEPPPGQPTRPIGFFSLASLLKGSIY